MMKRIFALLTVAALCASCEKKENNTVAETQTTVTESTVPATEPSAAVPAPDGAQAGSTPEDMLRTAQSSPLTNVTLDGSHYAFGKVKKGEKVHHAYTITNSGKNPLIISSVKPGCGCTVPEFTKEPILPGKTGKITLSFDSSSFEGMQNKQAEVYANVENAPIVLTFSADVQP